MSDGNLYRCSPNGTSPMKPFSLPSEKDPLSSEGPRLFIFLSPLGYSRPLLLSFTSMASVSNDLLQACVSTSVFTALRVGQDRNPSIHASTHHPSIHLSIHPSIHLSIYLFVIYLPTYPSTHLLHRSQNRSPTGCIY